MAIHTSVLFQGFSGSINRQLLFRQCGGRTVVSKFPDRSTVIYSEKQKQERRRFADAVSFARVVIADQGLKQAYSIKAAMLGFRSAWNVAIAEYMSEQPLKVRKKKIPFDKSQINYPEDSKLQIKLFRTIEAQSPVLVEIRRRKSRDRNIAKYRRDWAWVDWECGTAETVSPEYPCS
jgi:ribosomal protein L9